MSEQYDEKLGSMVRRNNEIHRWKMLGIREYVIRVNIAAESDMAITGIIEGAHHRAMLSVLKEMEKREERPA